MALLCVWASSQFGSWVPRVMRDRVGQKLCPPLWSSLRSHRASLSLPSIRKLATKSCHVQGKDTLNSFWRNSFWKSMWYRKYCCSQFWKIQSALYSQLTFLSCANTFTAFLKILQNLIPSQCQAFRLKDQDLVIYLVSQIPLQTRHFGCDP